MTRRSILGSTFLVLASVTSLAFAGGCDNQPSDGQRKAEQAQAEAEQKTAEAKREADRKIANAQAEAEKAAAEARADFTKTRDEYRTKMQTALSDLDKKVIELEAKAKKATGKAKTDLNEKLVTIKKNREALATDLKSLDNATAAEWDGTKQRLDKKWTELKTMVDDNA
jgi:hypothetical protein